MSSLVTIWGRPEEEYVNPVGNHHQRRIITKRSDGIPPKHFFDDGVDVWHRRSIVVVGEASRPDDGVQFCLCLGLDGGMNNHGQKKRGQ